MFRRLARPGIYKLGGGKFRLKPDQAEQFWQSEIRTITDLWEKIGTNYDHGISGVYLHECPSNLSIDDLRNILNAQATREAESNGVSWVQRHFFDLIFIAIVGAIILLYGRGFVVGLPYSSIGTWLGFGGPMIEQVAVTATDGLPAFHVVTADNIASVISLQEPNTFSATGAVLGQVTLIPILPGAVLHRNQVIPTCSHAGVNASATTEVFSLPLKSAVLSGVTAGSCVSLLLSAHDTRFPVDDLPNLDQVRVLDMRISGDNATIVVAAQLSARDWIKMRRLLGSSDVYVIQPPLP